MGRGPEREEERQTERERERERERRRKERKKNDNGRERRWYGVLACMLSRSDDYKEHAQPTRVRNAQRKLNGDVHSAHGFCTFGTKLRAKSALVNN